MEAMELSADAHSAATAGVSAVSRPGENRPPEPPHEYGEDAEEWLQRTLVYQPPVLETVELSPGVAIVDLNTGKQKVAEAEATRPMSRQEYLVLTQSHTRPKPVAKAQARHVDARVVEIQRLFQAMSSPHSHVMSSRSSPRSSPRRHGVPCRPLSPKGEEGNGEPRVSAQSPRTVPGPKDRVLGGTIVANRELLKQFFGGGSK
ncbi:Gbp1 [Symbiodinium sp. CCMP2592]|nr:Gbp1 [Symbiodinium sp. CCMP2592]